jgi:hypothetical protein
MTTESTAELVERTATVISGRIDAVFRDLQTIADELVTISATMPEPPRRKDFAFLKGRFDTFLRHHRGLIDGAGIAFQPGALADVGSWLEWWRMQKSGNPKFISHDLSPNSIQYYDYSTRDWFNLPAKSGRSVAVGPYVDMGGIKVSTITLSVPAIVGAATHVLGCDLSLSRLEELFLRTVLTDDLQIVMLGPNGRVIASNTARLVTGTLAGEELGRGESIMPIAPEDRHRLPWTLAVFSGQ